jgi:dihydrofolate reductase
MIHGYIAMSLDGYIADAHGSVGWLDEFQDVEYGYDDFFASIRTVVLGRKTYEQVVGFGWPYAGRRGLVVTARALDRAPDGVEAWHDGVDALVEHLHASTDGDVWVVGGAQLQQAMLEANAIDRLEIFVLPVTLGGGVPLFPKSARRLAFDLISATRLPAGMIRATYRPQS